MGRFLKGGNIFGVLLDYWDGHNWTNGGTGIHLGFGQLEDGRFYLVHGTQWQGQQDHAEVVSAERVVKEAIKADSVDELKDYPELMSIYEGKYNKKEISEVSKVFSLRINIRESEEETREKIEDFVAKIKAYKDLE